MRYYHPHLNGIGAQNLLLETGTIGGYLLRPSERNPCNFALSILNDTSVVSHFQINCTEDGCDLFGGQKYASLQDLIFAECESKPLIDRDRKEIVFRHPVNCSDPTGEKWYHGFLSRSEATRLLSGSDTDFPSTGTYLVRQSARHVGCYTISVVSQSGVDHILIRADNERFFVAGLELSFATLAELIEHYSIEELQLVNQVSVLLTEPFNSTTFVAENIKERIESLQKERSSRTKGVANVDCLSEEYSKLITTTGKDIFLRLVGSLPENRKFNRFKDIIPFDYSRVQLRLPYSTHDYINASHIVSCDTERRCVSTSVKCYIAAQGPTERSSPHFWWMIWLLQSHVIVMVTQEEEGGKKKCSHYWPDKESSLFFDNLTVTCLDEADPIDGIITRRFQMTLDKEKRLISHYQYIDWPDKGVPGHPGGILCILKLANEFQSAQGKKGPIVVHCSAGIGRTGTLIAIDIISSLVMEEGVKTLIDIYQTVKLIRRQRPGMVQTREQYSFIYTSVLHYIKILLGLDEALEESVYANSEIDS